MKSERIKSPNEVQDMGSASHDIFQGKSELRAIKEAYGETAFLFAHQIKERLLPDAYSILDIGASRGELLQQVLDNLPEYTFNTTGVDVNESALKDNTSAQNKILSSADKLPFNDSSVDVLIARYVLQWNSPDRQQEILSEMARVSKKLSLVEHAGADIQDPDTWQQATDELLNGEKIPKLKRGEHYYSSRNEIEAWLNKMGIRFERVSEKTINDLADIFIARYKLDEEESECARKILGDKNFFIKTDWAILPK